MSFIELIEISERGFEIQARGTSTCEFPVIDLAVSIMSATTALAVGISPAPCP